MLADFSALLPTGMSPGTALGLAALSLIASLITASLSLGGGTLMISVLSLVFPPTVALPVHGAIQLGSNSGRAFVQRAHIQWHLVLWMSLGAIPGAALGGHFATLLPEHLFRIAIGLFILASLWLPRPGVSTHSPLESLVGGLVISFAGMIVGATGPLVMTFIKDLADRRQIVGTHASLMSIQNVAKVSAFSLFGFAFAAYLPLILVMIGTGFIGTMIGSRLLLKLPDRGFRLGFKLLITALALDLLRRALFG